ncbi:methanogenesis marker 8 protein [Methanocaldococcus indicus]|uniref:methanogenesis marker 8 protein n=1 Tax=Methanocaldococcus indicus TaxID=213231 RepID=UPI003C6CECEC
MYHIMEALGARVYIKDGKVVKVEDTKLEYCPIYDKHRGIKKIDKDKIRENIEFRIKEFGLFTKNRKVIEDKYIVPFGASEILMSALKHKALDCAVVVADCAGTVITSNPYLVQGLCGRISGIIKTYPIKEVIERIEKHGGYVLNKDTAEINQFEGVKKAIELGYKRIAVTVTNSKDAKKIKSLENGDIKILTFGVHLINIDKIEHFDIITACASKKTREVKPKLQIGKTIPIFALTDFGKNIILERVKDLDNVLITLEKLPVLSENQPKPLL